MSATFKIY